MFDFLSPYYSQQQPENLYLSEYGYVGALKLYQELRMRSLYNQKSIIKISDFFESHDSGYRALYYLAPFFSQTEFPWCVYYHSILAENQGGILNKTKRLPLPNKETIFLTDDQFPTIAEYCAAYIRQIQNQGEFVLSGEGKAAALQLCSLAGLNTIQTNLKSVFTGNNNDLLDLTWEAANRLNVDIGTKPFLQ